VGSGKTARTISDVADLLATSPEARVFWFVPDHRLASEAAARLRGGLPPGTLVEVWLGRDRPDPAATDGAAMCRRLDAVRLIEGAGEAMDAACGGPQRGMCPFHPENPATAASTPGCGYRRQAAAVPGTGVVVLTHASLAHLPAALRRPDPGTVGPFRNSGPAADFVVIDEAFFPALLRMKGATVPLADLASRHWAAVPHIPEMLEHATMPSQHVQEANSILVRWQALATTGDGRMSASLLAHVEPEKPAPALSLLFAQASAFVLRTRQPVTIDPAGEATGIGAAVAAVAGTNRRATDTARLLKLAAQVADGRAGGASLRADAAGIVLSWREELDPRLASAPLGILHLDATMPDDIARVFLPGLIVHRPLPASQPHVRVVQVEDSTVSYSSLMAGRAVAKKNKRGAESRAAKVEHALTNLAARYAGRGAPSGPDVLAVMPKELEASLAGKLPVRVGTLHYGALRGQDFARGVAALLVVSRPLPSPIAMEDQAEVIFGRDVTRLPAGEFYSTRAVQRLMADGSTREATAVYHPGALVEVVRAAHCDAELIQAIGRGRGLLRTAANPLDVYVLTDVVLNAAPPHELRPLRDILRDLAGQHPADKVLALGYRPHDWKGLGLALQHVRELTGVRDVADAARQLAGRVPDFGARLHAGVERWKLAANSGHSSVEILTEIQPEFATLDRVESEAAYVVPTSYSPAPQGGRTICAGYPHKQTRHNYRRCGERNLSEVDVAPWLQEPRAEIEKAMGALSVFGPAGGVKRGRTTASTCSAPVAIRTSTDLCDVRAAQPGKSTSGASADL
jgi:putative DNA primase/helicase